jgi:transcriptional regulator with XRE-family HTH domain
VYAGIFIDFSQFKQYNKSSGRRDIMGNDKRVATTAERLREAMAEAGMRQTDLAHVTGLDKGSLSSYLSGRYEPKQRAVGQLAQALSVSEMWLWGYDVPKARSEEQKKNDDLVKVIAQLRKDPDFFEVVSVLADLPAGEYAGIKALISALGKK